MHLFIFSRLPLIGFNQFRLGDTHKNFICSNDLACKGCIKILDICKCQYLCINALYITLKIALLSHDYILVIFIMYMKS